MAHALLRATVMISSRSGRSAPIARSYQAHAARRRRQKPAPGVVAMILGCVAVSWQALHDGSVVAVRIAEPEIDDVDAGGAHRALTASVTTKARWEALPRAEMSSLGCHRGPPLS